MENYPLIHFPVDKAFDEMTLKEGKITFEWFLSIIPERMAVLEKAVREDFPAWRADYTRESLYDLGKWVKAHVKMRKLGKQEKETIIRERKMGKFQADLIRETEEKLSPGSERIRFDVGIYLGETLRKNMEYLEWHLEKRKSMASFNTPVLKKVKDAPKNSFPMIVLEICLTAVFGMAEKSIKDDRFVGIYDYWHRELTVGSPPLPPELMP